MNTLTLLIKTPVIIDLRNLLKQYDLTFTLMASVKAPFPDKVTFIHIGGLLKVQHILEGGDTIQPVTQVNSQHVTRKKSEECIAKAWSQKVFKRFQLTTCVC